MITQLTPDQESKITEYRDHYFAQATSTEPADRPRAEQAAIRMAEIAGVKINEVIWCKNPDDGYQQYDKLRASLSDSIRASLSDSIRASLSDSLRDSLWASLRASLWASLSDSLWASLWASLRASLSDSLRDSLSDSLWASLRDTGWLAYYSCAVDVLGVEMDDKNRELLDLHNEIAASCFAVWIVPGTAILCERPTSVKIIDGKLVDLKFS